MSLRGGKKKKEGRKKIVFLETKSRTDRMTTYLKIYFAISHPIKFLTIRKPIGSCVGLPDSSFLPIFSTFFNVKYIYSYNLHCIYQCIQWNMKKSLSIFLLCSLGFSLARFLGNGLVAKSGIYYRGIIYNFYFIYYYYYFCVCMKRKIVIDEPKRIDPL